MKLMLHGDHLQVQPGQQNVQLPHYASALRALSRVRSLHISLSAARSLDTCLHFLESLFPYKGFVEQGKRWSSAKQPCGDESFDDSECGEVSIAV